MSGHAETHCPHCNMPFAEHTATRAGLACPGGYLALLEPHPARFDVNGTLKRLPERQVSL